MDLSVGINRFTYLLTYLLNTATVNLKMQQKVKSPRQVGFEVDRR